MVQQELLEEVAYSVFLVPQHLIGESWRRLFPLIEFALDYGCGEFDEQSIFDSCLRGDMYLWAVLGDDNVFYAAAITELAIYPRAVHYWVTMLGGYKMKEWREQLQEAFEAHALRCGATWIRANCRPGMQRMLAPLGYSHKYVSVGKQISEEPSNVWR